MNPSQKAEYYKRPYSKKSNPKVSAQDIKIEAMVRKAVLAESKKLSKKVESKMYDQVTTASAVDYTGSVVNLTSGISQGASDAQYLGSSIRPSTLRIRWNLVSADATQMFRIIVLQTIGGGTPTTATVLASVTNIRAPLSAFDVDYMSTFKVLYDEFYGCVASTTSSHLTGDIRIRYDKMRSIHFTDASGTIESNGIYLLVISDSSAVSHPVFQSYSRLYYKDM